MSGTQPPGVPTFYPGYSAYSQFNSGMNNDGGIRDTFNFMNNRPKFRARRVAAQTLTIGSSAHQFIVWDTIDFDNYNGWGPNQTPAQSANTYVVQAPGWYLITARVSISCTGATGLILVPSISVNGSSPTGYGTVGWEGPTVFVPTGGPTQPKCSNACWEVYAGLGATIQLDIFYSNEATVSATDTTVGFQPEISLVWSGK